MKYTLDELVKNSRELYHSSGYFKGYFSAKDAEITINYSTILSYLIKEAGRLCESYSSDLFIQWNSILEKLKNSDYYNGTPKENKKDYFLFGIKETGVDSNDWILGNLEDYKHYAHLYYRKVYLLTIETTCGYVMADSFDGNMVMTLSECRI